MIAVRRYYVYPKNISTNLLLMPLYYFFSQTFRSSLSKSYIYVRTITKDRSSVLKLLQNRTREYQQMLKEKNFLMNQIIQSKDEQLQQVIQNKDEQC